MKTVIIALAMITVSAAHAGEAEEDQKHVHAEAAFRCAALAYYFNDLAEQERLETLGMKVAINLAEKPLLKGTLPAELTIDLDTTARVLLGVKIGVMRTQGYWSVSQELYTPITPEDYTTRVPQDARKIYSRANCRLIN